tara:strand:- start:189 stop:740 length:552 start_codon:yes stop_codon:yes gene_type:complete
MGKLDHNKKYLKVENFLDKGELTFLKNYTFIRHQNNYKNEAYDKNTDYDTFFYADPLMESILISKKSLVEKLTDKKLLPTYSFWRMYTYFSDLPMHTDRESCEYSVTVNLAQSGEEWPIYMDETPVNTNPGDAVIYLGRQIKHGRKKFTGDYYAQCFLHYVDKNGPYKDFLLDKRPILGFDKK